MSSQFTQLRVYYYLNLKRKKLNYFMTMYKMRSSASYTLKAYHLFKIAQH